MHPSNSISDDTAMLKTASAPKILNNGMACCCNLLIYIATIVMRLACSGILNFIAHFLLIAPIKEICQEVQLRTETESSASSVAFRRSSVNGRSSR